MESLPRTLMDPSRDAARHASLPLSRSLSDLRALQQLDKRFLQYAPNATRARPTVEESMADQTPLSRTLKSISAPAALPMPTDPRHPSGPSYHAAIDSSPATAPQQYHRAALESAQAVYVPPEWQMEYLPDPGLLICRPCGVALWGDIALTHLKDQHNHIVPEADFARIVDSIPRYCMTNREVPVRPPHLSPVPYIKIEDGFCCTMCGYAGGMRILKEHIRADHPDRKVKPWLEPYIKPTKMQRYYPFQNMRIYFAVKA